MSKKKLYKDLIINLACLAFLSFCCLSITFSGFARGQTPSTLQPTPTATPIASPTKPGVSVATNLATSTYTPTPTAINALTPTISPTAVPTNTAVTPFILPTKVPTKTPSYDLYYYPSLDYEADDYSDPGLPSAICRDGTLSYSAHRRGTCSHHGGVAQWLLSLP